MKNHEKNGTIYMSRNLGLSGLALILTAGLIIVGRPENIFILTTRYMGDPEILSQVLALLGVLTASLGYALRRKF